MGRGSRSGTAAGSADCSSAERNGSRADSPGHEHRLRGIRRVAVHPHLEPLIPDDLLDIRAELVEHQGTIRRVLVAPVVAGALEVDHDTLGQYPSVLEASWSHDSSWLAYTKSGKESWTNSVYLYNVEQNTSHQVTSDYFSQGDVTFDRAGDFLYFVGVGN